MLYAVIFLAVLLLITLLLRLRIKAAVEYVRDEKDDDVVFSFYMLKGMFKYKYEIPLADAGKKNARFKLVRENARSVAAEENKKRVKPLEIIDKIADIKEYYDRNRDIICDIRDYVHGRVLLMEFDLSIKEGTGNACYTGIFCGVLWSLAGSLTSYLSNTVKVVKKCVSIFPCFNDKVFTVHFHCIFHVRLVHIIVVLMKIYRSKRRMKAKLDKKIGGGLSGRAASSD